MSYAMRALLASLAMLALAVTGMANCAVAQGPDGSAAMEAGAHAYAHLPPCHWPAGFDPEAEQAIDVAETAACQGGAACVECALGIGLMADMAPLGGAPLHGAPHLFAVKLAIAGPSAHEPPPPRA